MILSTGNRGQSPFDSKVTLETGVALITESTQTYEEEQIEEIAEDILEEAIEVLADAVEQVRLSELEDQLAEEEAIEEVVELVCALETAGVLTVESQTAEEQLVEDIVGGMMMASELNAEEEEEDGDPILEIVDEMVQVLGQNFASAEQ